MDDRDPETYALIGAGMTVHSELGPGFLEPVYQEALAIELDDLKIPFEREVQIPVHYKGRLLASSYRADLVCFGSIIVELKAIKEIGNIEEAQLLNYLKATGLRKGLLLNFGATRLQVKRFVR